MKLPSKSEKPNLLDMTIQMFLSLGINVCKTDIKFASSKSIPSKKGSEENIQLVIVEFIDFDTKLRVMKEKRELDTNRHNHSLMGKIKDVGKAKSFAVYISNSRIYAKKNDSKFKAIECENDIQVVENWESNKKRASSQAVQNE